MANLPRPHPIRHLTVLTPDEVCVGNPPTGPTSPLIKLYCMLSFPFARVLLVTWTDVRGVNLIPTLISATFFITPHLAATSEHKGKQEYSVKKGRSFKLGICGSGTYDLTTGETDIGFTLEARRRSRPVALHPRPRHTDREVGTQS